MQRHLLISSLVACLAAAPGLAVADSAVGLACTFDVECYETEACEATAYEAEIKIDEGYADRRATVESVVETLSGMAYPIGEDGWLVQVGSDNGPVMITVHAGSARMAVHGGTAPMMINYSGTCEVMD